jgi:hypothetical protein
MKNKSNFSNWAIALCAVAVFSIAGTAYGVIVQPLPGPTIMPISEVPVKPRPQPLPPIAPPVGSGTYTGTVIVD